MVGWGIVSAMFGAVREEIPSSLPWTSGLIYRSLFGVDDVELWLS